MKAIVAVNDARQILIMEYYKLDPKKLDRLGADGPLLQDQVTGFIDAAPEKPGLYEVQIEMSDNQVVAGNFKPYHILP